MFGNLEKDSKNVHTSSSLILLLYFFYSARILWKSTRIVVVGTYLGSDPDGAPSLNQFNQACWCTGALYTMMQMNLEKYISIRVFHEGIFLPAFDIISSFFGSLFERQLPASWKWVRFWSMQKQPALIPSTFHLLISKTTKNFWTFETYSPVHRSQVSTSVTSTTSVQVLNNKTHKEPTKKVSGYFWFSSGVPVWITVKTRNPETWKKMLTGLHDNGLLTHQTKTGFWVFEAQFSEWF